MLQEKGWGQRTTWMDGPVKQTLLEIASKSRIKYSWLAFMSSCFRIERIPAPVSQPQAFLSTPLFRGSRQGSSLKGFRHVHGAGVKSSH